MASDRLLTRPFKLTWAFYFCVFAVGYQLYPVLPLRMRDLGASLAESGRFMALFMIGSGVGALFTGSLGDRLGPRRVMMGASLLCAAFFAAYAFVGSTALLLLLAPLHGVVWSALRTSGVSKAGGLLPEENKAEGLTIFGLASPSGVALGPLVGLFLFPRLGIRPHMLLLALGFLGEALLARQLPKDRPHRDARPALLQAPEPWLWPVAALLFVLALSYGPMPPYAAQEAKALGLAWPSALLTCFALGMMGLRLILGFTGLGRDPLRLLPWMLLLAAFGNALLVTLPGGLGRHIAGALVYGAGYGMVHTLVFTAALTHAAPARRGAGVGLLYASFDAGSALGAWGIGPVMERWSFRHGWAVGAVALLLVLPLARTLARRFATPEIRHA
ncbi:MAG TPA: MFS transporter [Holophagaceae bacterium]|nr:MFS transporter [Holophagaceae bacterium]